MAEERQAAGIPANVRASTMLGLGYLIRLPHAFSELIDHVYKGTQLSPQARKMLVGCGLLSDASDNLPTTTRDIVRELYDENGNLRSTT